MSDIIFILNVSCVVHSLSSIFLLRKKASVHYRTSVSKVNIYELKNSWFRWYLINNQIKKTLRYFIQKKITKSEKVYAVLQKLYMREIQVFRFGGNMFPQEISILV